MQRPFPTPHTNYPPDIFPQVSNPVFVRLLSLRLSSVSCDLKEESYFIFPSSSKSWFCVRTFTPLLFPAIERPGIFSSGTKHFRQSNHPLIAWLPLSRGHITSSILVQRLRRCQHRPCILSSLPLPLTKVHGALIASTRSGCLVTRRTAPLTRSDAVKTLYLLWFSFSCLLVRRSAPLRVCVGLGGLLFFLISVCMSL